METREELYNYIKTFNKIQGQYSKEDLYKIGLEHKNLPLNQKNWKELAEYVGYPGKPENYRKFIYYIQQKGGEISEGKALSYSDPEYESSFKDKVQLRDLISTYNSSIRSDARAENFIQGLKEAAKNMPAITINPKKVTYQGLNREAVLLFSDLHIGVFCDNFYNIYNIDIAKERVQMLVEQVIKYCEQFEITKLNVLNLGDMIHGLIHVTGRIQAQFNVVEQIVQASEIVTKMLLALDEHIPFVTYRSCTDNHSRLIANYKENIEEENLGTLIDIIVEERLKNSSIKFVKDNLDPSIMYFKLNNGKTFMAAHGHLEKPDKVIDDFTGAIKVLPDFVALSHYHAARTKAYNGSTLFINGSIVGTEEYALSKRLFNKAEQSLLIFDEDNVINCSIKLS